MSENANLALLHLSDLHIRNDDEEKIDRAMVLDPLLERLGQDYKKGFRPELVLVTGDIAYQGIQAEYELALPFLQDLLGVLHLDARRLYMVPGNHDVCRKAYRPTEIPRYQSNREINAELGDQVYRADLLKGMRSYFEFIENHYPHMTSAHGDLVPFVGRFKSQGGLSVGLVGLNSAWMCRTPKPGEDDSGQIAIGEHQVKSAFAELKSKGEADATLVLVHHPLSWLASMDRHVCEQHLKRTITLAGHLHEPAGGYVHGFSTQMVHIQAGGAYLGSDSSWPCRYHYIGIDRAGARVLMDFRSFSASRRRWLVDTETGDDAGAADIPAEFLGAKAEDSTVSAIDLPEFPESYALWLKGNYGFLEAEKLNPTGKAPPLSLPELFVPLHGADPSPTKNDSDDLNQLMVTTKPDSPYEKYGEPKMPEIENLVAKHSALLIEGQAGSGKSTLLKHLAYTLSPVTQEKPSFPGLSDYLPVLILLKDLQAYCLSDMGRQSRTCPVGEELMEWYLKNRLSGKLDMEILRRFVSSGRALLLVDGLDEIDRPIRDHAVNAIADLALAHPENKIVLTGRPHGLEGVPSNRFGRFATSVQDLSPSQIQRFVRQWFDYFYPGTEGVGKKTAEKMLGGFKDHPAVQQLTVNPLMLTAICLLYLDNKELPEQRAELFKKFIDNMIWRRFDDPEPMLDHLKNLAHEMHRQRVRMVDKCVAVQAISMSFKMEPEEKPAAFKKRIEKYFDAIEPQCGLLISRGGQTGFWHLAFQEFLTAQHLIDTSSNYHDAVADFWNDDWYKEVVELYASYLSIDHRQTANDIVDRVLQAQDQAPYRRWRLAARTLVDFHASRRIPEVVAQARKRLKRIIEKPLEPGTLADAGETLGWLGDSRDLESFAPVCAGVYDLEEREKKKNKKTIEAFELGRYPVTNQWFQRFVDAGGYATENIWTDYGKSWLRSEQPRQPATWMERRYRCPNQPVTGVSWYEAVAFCNWLTEQDEKYRYFVPSAFQWQAAAAGNEKRTYPWGDEAPTGRCNIRESKIDRPSPVGIFSGGCTPGNTEETIYDLGGNVWEWTCTSYRTAQDTDDFIYAESFQERSYDSAPILKVRGKNNFRISRVRLRMVAKYNSTWVKLCHT
jgi:energy-coupling factor transporter ATP-binding protein EcfA2/predicted MPP superfamily phosphohydrolase